MFKPANLLLQLFLLLLITPVLLYAQQAERYSFSYRLLTLDEALMRLSEETGINIVYDAEVTKNIRVNGSASNQTIESVLDDLLDRTLLQYRISESGTYIIYRARAGFRTTGGIMGTIKDWRTGEPVEGVNVYIESARRGSTTDSGGRYLIERLEPGEYLLRVSHVSYSPSLRQTEVSRGLTSQYDFGLRPAILTETQIIVTDALSPLQYMRAGRDVVEPGAFLLQTAGGTPDAMRALADIPGVRFQNPLSDMIVQGSNATNHRIKLDGTMVFSPLSMGRLLSAFSPYAVRRLTLHRAGFPASMGSSLSGVVSVEQSAVLPGDDPFLIQADLNSTNFRMLQQWDLPDREQLYLMLALRIKSPWSDANPSSSRVFDSLNKPDQPLFARKTSGFSQGVFQNISRQDHSLGFYDMHLSMLYRSADLSSTALTAYVGESTLRPGLETSNPPAGQQLLLQDDYRWQNQIANVRHNRLVSDEGSMSAVFRVSRHQYNQAYNAQTGEAEPVLLYSESFSHDASFVTAQLDYSHEWSERIEILTGLDIGFSSINLDVSDFLQDDVLFKELQVQFSGFTELKLNTGNYQRIILGSRFTHIGGLGLFAEPRIALGMDFPDTPSGNWSVEFAGGLFRDYLQQFVLSNTSPNGIFAENNFWLPVNSIGIVPKSWHAAVDVRWQPHQRLTLRFDPYYKWQPKEAVVDYASTGSFNGSDEGVSAQAVLINARSYTAGVGFNIEYVYSQIFVNALYNISHVRQRIANRYDGRYVQPYWAEPHQFIAAGRWVFTEHFSASARFELLPGRRGWALRRAYYTNLAYEDPAWSGQFDDPETDRLSTYNQFDLGLSWNRSFSRTTWSVTAELQNIFGSRNEYDRGLRQNGFNSNGNEKFYSRSAAHLQPGLSIMVTF